MDVDYFPLKGNELLVYFTRNIRALLESKDSPLSAGDLIFARPSCFIHSEWKSEGFEKQYGLDVRLGELNANEGVITAAAFLDLIMQTWQINAEAWPDLGLGISYFNPTFKITIAITAQAAKLKPDQRVEDVKELDPEQFPLKTKEFEIISPPEGLLYPDKVREQLGLPKPGMVA